MKDRKPQRPGANSVSSHIAAIGNASREVPLPEGVTLRSDEEAVIWRQFTRARATADWRDMDLILLVKAVKVEADIRKFQEILDAEGITLLNQKGTQIVNPLVSYLDTLLRQQLAIIRSMSLTKSSSAVSVLEASAKQENAARETLKRSGVVSLLAQPA